MARDPTTLTPAPDSLFFFFHFPPVDPVTICLLAVSSRWGEVMVTDPLFVLHMSPQQLPRLFFFISQCPQPKIATELPPVISNKLYWLVLPCPIISMCWERYENCFSFPLCRSLCLKKCPQPTQPGWSPGSKLPPGNGRPLLALSHLFSILSEHSICHSLIQRKTSTFKAPHPFQRELTFRT